MTKPPPRELTKSDRRRLGAQVLSLMRDCTEFAKHYLEGKKVMAFEEINTRSPSRAVKTRVSNPIPEIAVRISVEKLRERAAAEEARRRAAYAQHYADMAREAAARQASNIV